MENWLSMKRNGGTGTAPSSSTATAVVPDLNIEVKIVSWLWYVRPRCAGLNCDVPGVGRLHGVDKSHERVELVVRDLVGNSRLSRRGGAPGLQVSGLLDLQCGHSVVGGQLGGDWSQGSQTHSGNRGRRSEGRQGGYCCRRGKLKSFILWSYKRTIGLWQRCRCRGGFNRRSDG